MNKLAAPSQNQKFAIWLGLLIQIHKDGGKVVLCLINYALCHEGVCGVEV
jgi:hypothetical protein